MSAESASVPANNRASCVPASPPERSSLTKVATASTAAIAQPQAASAKRRSGTLDAGRGGRTGALFRRLSCGPGRPRAGLRPSHLPPRAAARRSCPGCATAPSRRSTKGSSAPARCLPAGGRGCAGSPSRGRTRGSPPRGPWPGRAGGVRASTQTPSTPVSGCGGVEVECAEGHRDAAVAGDEHGAVFAEPLHASRGRRPHRTALRGRRSPCQGRAGYAAIPSQSAVGGLPDFSCSVSCNPSSHRGHHRRRTGRKCTRCRAGPGTLRNDTGWSCSGSSVIAMPSTVWSFRLMWLTYAEASRPSASTA